MKLVKLLSIICKVRIFSPLGFARLLAGIGKYGFNLMALLFFAGRTYGDKIAIVDDEEPITYCQLLSQTEQLAVVLHEKYRLNSGQKVGLLCRNHAALVKAVFAVSRLAADSYLLNAEMSKSQLKNLVERYDFALLVYDLDLSTLVEQSGYTNHKLLSWHDSLPAINNLLAAGRSVKLKLERTSVGKVVLLTSGTTGAYKAAPHQPSPCNYVMPMLALLTRLKLANYRTAYIATPIYHGYGVALLLLFIALGKKVIVTKRFTADKACALIERHQVEVAAVVPLMIAKMLKHNPEALRSLTCLASGGAELNPNLVAETFNKLGAVIYNLYGTSEVGLNIIATPQDLKYSPKTIGTKIAGAHIKILDDANNEVATGQVGRIYLKNSWSMATGNYTWLETGDLGYRDGNGYYFLCGRSDDLVVSAGENVYPVEIEQALKNHPQVAEAAVIGMPDKQFGQRLKAYVLLRDHAGLTQEELLIWLRPRVARFQMPKEIAFVDQLPYNAAGKLDKKRLKGGG